MTAAVDNRRRERDAQSRALPCSCYRCAVESGEHVVRMILCETCGNKRCPHGTDHRNACTASNAAGQPGSRYADGWTEPYDWKRPAAGGWAGLSPSERGGDVIVRRGDCVAVVGSGRVATAVPLSPQATISSEPEWREADPAAAMAMGPLPAAAALALAELAEECCPHMIASVGDTVLDCDIARLLIARRLIRLVAFMGQGGYAAQLTTMGLAWLHRREIVSRLGFVEDVCFPVLREAAGFAPKPSGEDIRTPWLRPRATRRPIIPPAWRGRRMDAAIHEAAEWLQQGHNCTRAGADSLHEPVGPSIRAQGLFATDPCPPPGADSADPEETAGSSS